MLDEEDLNKFEEDVSENKACSSSVESREVNVCRRRVKLARPFRQLC